MDHDDLPPEMLPEEVWHELLQRSSGLQRFIRENFGLNEPPGDHRAIRAENIRRTQRNRALGG
jgi:hypothetical protein